MLEVDVLADDANLDGARATLFEALDDPLPAGEVRRAAPDIETLSDELVEPLLVEHERHFVDAPDVDGADDGFDGDVREEGDFLFHAPRKSHLRAAEEDVGLDADFAHLLDGVLGRLHLELSGGRDEGDEGDVDVERVLRARLDLHLAHGLEEGQGLDVAGGAADLDDGDVDTFGRVPDAGLDLVGDVGADLNGGAEVFRPRRSFEMRRSRCRMRPVVKLFWRIIRADVKRS